MSKNTGQRALAAGLRTAADELAELAALSERQQALIADLANRVALSADHLMDLQGADFLTQHLNGLERFLTVVADACPADAQYDSLLAVAGLSLTAQARRLAGMDWTIAANDCDDLLLFGD